MVKAYQTPRYPRTDPEVEKISAGSGLVTTRKMTPEEIERYGNYQPQEDRDAYGKVRKKPINIPIKEDDEMKEKKYSHLTKEFFEEAFAAGKTPTEIQREEKLPGGSIFYYMKRAGVKYEPKTDNSFKQNMEVDRQAIIENLGEEIDRLRDELSKKSSDHRHCDTEITRLRDGLKKVIEEKDKVIAYWQGEFARLTDDNKELRQELSDMTKELASVVTVIENEVENPSMEQLPGMITIHLPIISCESWTWSEQGNKVFEELDEFKMELKNQDPSHQNTIGELIDLVQAYTGLIRIELSDLLDGEEVDKQLVKFFDRMSQQHIEKIQGYAKERGWRLAE